ncbi:regulatory signaling modulator protein AmpE [Aliidiomarina halalkaliphila]|uniref:Regulatory signaling modulator protein AmpE n=1 Tax=Aliidiomarina halalkaliphila TaxID=2593535 RepID=A0A552X5V5_9GAMM|nr:regulatory signaling modulator protein AmpE [Aliidiomarina halalkaliphila]TRW50392.1 regulatory signaling modulator protein AmpE [Aliidiomarina halalkaliphila]
MVVLSLLIALILERFRITPEGWQLEPTANRWDQWLSDHEQLGSWRQHDLLGPLLLISPAILLAFLLWLSNSILAMLIINVLVLTLAIGCRAQRTALRQFLLAANRGDEEARKEFANELRYVNDDELTIGQQLVWLNFRFYFAVAFWFAIFGAAGALAYTLLRARADSVPKLLAWVEWLPLRAAGFGFLLVGHFSRALPHWLKSFSAGVQNPPGTLGELASRAEEVLAEEDDHTSEPDALVNLVRRNMVLLLAVVAVATLFGWAL